jgi:hypothetical protein
VPITTNPAIAVKTNGKALTAVATQLSILAARDIKPVIQMCHMAIINVIKIA